MRAARLITDALGVAPVGLSPLSGGCVGEVWSFDTPDGEELVAKVDDGARGQLDLEGWMLDYLREHTALPVPRVRHAEPRLLVMTRLRGTTGCAGGAEEHLAELLAELHSVTAPEFGLSRDTLIGALPQPNEPCSSWIPFFAEHRLLHMARLAADAGRLPDTIRREVERVASRLDRWLEEPAGPGLVHGDVWSGNVLSDGSRVTGLIDPAIYYADPEVELAFITLFHTVGDRFFASYRERHAIEPGFFELRRHLYNLYPLLVHVRLFGAGYLGDLSATLRRLA